MTTHHVTARLTPGASSIVIDGVDVSAAVTKAGTRLHFNDGAPVLTVQTMPDTVIDLTADAEVRVESPRRLAALDRLAARGITGLDALTALDTLITRALEHVVRGTEDVSAGERAAYLASVFGSDAARVASVLLAPASSDDAVAELREKLSAPARCEVCTDYRPGEITRDNSGRWVCPEDRG